MCGKAVVLWVYDPLTKNTMFRHAPTVACMLKFMCGESRGAETSNEG